MIITNDAITLAQQLPTVILYLVYGFIFFEVFTLTASMRGDNGPKAMFMYSLAIGFIILNTAYIIPITTNILWLDHLLIGLAALLCGYLLGRITDSEACRNLLEKVKIFYTPAKYLWYDTVGKKGDTWIIIKYLDKNIAYKGVLSGYEEQERFPQITLTRYCVYRANRWKKIKDCSKDDRKIMLDTSKADSIEFLYTTKNRRKTR